MGKRSYKELLKESIVREFDTSKTADVKGPMLSAILSYEGDGELHTHQDAASILERYYYGENKDDGVNVMEAPQNEIPEVPADNLNKAKDDIEDEVESKKPDGDSSAVLIKSGPEDIEESIVEKDLENTVLERLIAELEEQEKMEDEDEKEDEKKDEKEDEKEMEPKDVEKLDVDKELKEADGGGSLPGGKTSTGKKLGTSGSYSGDDELEEAFQLFQEQIEDEVEDEDEDEDEDEGGPETPMEEGKEKMKGKTVKGEKK